MSATVLDRLFANMQGSRGLPMLDHTGTAVLSSVGGGRADDATVVNHIIEDVALTQKVLKLANSAMYAPFAPGADSVSSAVKVLGSDALVHLVLGTAQIGNEELHEDENLSRGLLASELARYACADRAEDASIATVMSDLGRMLVTRFLPQEAASVEKKLAAGSSPNEAARAVLGISLQEIGVEVAKRWNFPTSLLASIDGTGDPTLMKVARFSSTASGLMHKGQSEELKRLVEELDIPGIDKAGFSNYVSSRAQTVRRADRSSAASTARTAAPMSEAEGQMADLLGILTQNRKNTVDELAAAMFPPISAALEMAHCLLFMLTRTGEFRVRSGVGKGIDELKARLRISAEFKPTAFHAVVKNNVDVSIEDVTKLKATSVPDAYFDLLPKVNKFVILPIAHSRVSGLLYCDWDIERNLTKSEMEAVKKLRNLFVPFMP